jgi:putative intracellular protease/amidase
VFGHRRVELRDCDAAGHPGCGFDVVVRPGGDGGARFEIPDLDRPDR